MKKTSLVILMALGACQQSGTTIVVHDRPASEAAESADRSKLPEGFPLIAEMSLTPTPKGCGLSKIKGLADKSDDSRYVFVSRNDEGADESIYQVGINGTVRSFKASDAADMGEKKVRFFKTVDAPQLELQVVLQPEGSSEKSIVGRVKAWDAGVPLMCAYNRIEVEGDCEL